MADQKSIETSDRAAQAAIVARNAQHEVAVDKVKTPELEGVEGVNARLAITNRLIEVNTPDEARQWAALDAADFRKIEDADRREETALLMAGIRSEYYQSGLKVAAPDVAEAVGNINRENDKRISDKEARKSADVQVPAAAADDARERVDAALKKQAEEELLRRKQRETELAGQGLNSVDVQRKGREIDRADIILPRRITQAYTEVDGKFFAKDSNRLMFHDKGDKLATSTTDKDAIADMVAYAKAKQWDSLKLTGSQEFRREAWLQAESQGIRTQGYTPKDADIAELKELTQARSTNSITPLQERKQERDAATAEPAVAAPRHDLNKNQAAMHDAATKNVSANMQELQKKPGLANKDVAELTKLAFWRGVVIEQNKNEPATVRDDALDRFDKLAQDPQFLKRINEETLGDIKERTTDQAKEQKRETPEHSL
jgi:hypothetical protein